MDTAKAAQIKAHARALAQLLYEETEICNPQQLENFEGIEQAVRDHILEHVGPEIGDFFAKAQAVSEPGAAVRLRASSAMSKSPKTKRQC